MGRYALPVNSGSVALFFFFEHSVIFSEWSFGQVIAVAIWLPSVVEYVYLEWSRFHSPLYEVRAFSNSRRWDYERLNIQVFGLLEADGLIRRIFGYVVYLTA